MLRRFSEEYIERLQETYSNEKGNSQILNGIRYYIEEINITDSTFYMCLPIHSNCRGRYIKLSLPNKDDKWKNHGIDIQKMLIVKKEILDRVSFIIICHDHVIPREIYTEIEHKRQEINRVANDYINKWIKIENKDKKSLNDYNFQKYSSLNHFQKEISLIMKEKTESTP